MQHDKGFGFYFEANSEQFMISEQRCDMSRFAIWGLSLWLQCRNELEDNKNRDKEIYEEICNGRGNE